MIRKSLLIPAFLAVAAVVMIAIGVMSVVGAPESVTGQVVSVEQASVTTISSLTLMDDSGKQWTFEGGGTFAGFTPSHLEEHRALQEQVTVEYEKSDSGKLMILRLSD